MKALILAAGYATRLFPLTKNFPKPLLPINKRPMIEYIMDKIEELGITETYVVTNEKFYSSFKDWGQGYSGKSSIIVLNDHTTSDADKLGGVGDINFAIKAGKIEDDLLIVGGDNIFKFSLKEALNLFEEKKEATIVSLDVGNLEDAKRFGVVEIEEDGKVTSFEEKPENPKSSLCAICVYMYPKKILPQIQDYLDAGNNPDAPGNFPSWLVNNGVVYSKSFSGEWFDVGSFESLKEAKEKYGEINVSLEKLKSGQIE